MSIWVDLSEPLRIPRDIGVAAPTVEQPFGYAVEQISVCGALVSASSLPPPSCPRGCGCDALCCPECERVGGAR